MNDPRTCVYGHARAFGACGKRGECTRPRGLACLCGLQKATVPEPGPDKLTRPRNVYTSRRLSGWTHKMVHTCVACEQEFETEHRAAFHLCPSAGEAPAQGAASPWTHTYSGRLVDSVAQAREPWPFPGPQSKLFNVQGTTTGRISSHEPHFEELPRAAQRSLGLEDMDLSKLEERVVAHCSECAEFTQAAWDALGRCPWDNWKPGRDV